ncbi:hypothetical protein TrST_g8735 [Triparma strigata]|uniref:Ankyrin repeat protein n=1 Tax=Triparma strigata TaxID=1606541 RepID=A0A9W7F466_9STRA|nr:hypothetical protein TrST_g8735 [Triparma strigata]
MSAFTSSSSSTVSSNAAAATAPSATPSAAPTVDDLFQHCANLIATSLSSLVTSSDHASLYASYKLSLNSTPYNVTNRDANRPAIWNVKDRFKFNTVCEYMDENKQLGMDVNDEEGWKEKYVEVVRGIHARKFTGKFFFDTEQGGGKNPDLLDEYPLNRVSGSNGGSDVGGVVSGDNVLENTVSQPVFAREVDSFDSDIVALVKAQDAEALNLMPPTTFKGEVASLTPLHYACDNPHASGVKVVEIILDKLKECDVEAINQPDADDTTPLVTAMISGNSDVVKLLLERGARCGEKEDWEDMVDSKECRDFWTAAKAKEA